MNNLTMPTGASRIAVVGAGYWGKNLVRNFFELGALYAICDSDINNPNLAQYGETVKYVAFSDVINDEKVDAVVVATPAEMHFRMAKEALLAGKHVYVEKPLCLSESDGAELVTLARERHRILMVGHLLQYHPAFLRLNELVRAGELGRVDYVYSHRLNLGKIRREENILWSFAPHDISMILSLAGEMPETVFATGGNYLHKKIADVTTTHLDFPSGLKAHIFVSWLHPFKEQKLVVVGESKMAVFNDTLSWEEKLVLYPHHIEWKAGHPVPHRAKGEPVDLTASEPLRVQAEHFLACIRSGAVPRTDGEEGIRVLRVLNAAQAAMETGKPIRLDAPTGSRDRSYYAHESSYIDAGVIIGAGTRIWHFSHILPETHIGADCNIGQNVVIGPDVRIGNGCKIQNNVSVYKGVTLEDNVFCGPSMVFTNVYNPRVEVPRMDQIRPTLVKRGATIGANATIVCGHTIGAYAFIGAGAVVTRNVPDYALMLGNPAKQAGWMCRCGVRMEQAKKRFACSSCGRRYVLEAAGLRPTSPG